MWGFPDAQQNFFGEGKLADSEQLKLLIIARHMSTHNTFFFRTLHTLLGVLQTEVDNHEKNVVKSLVGHHGGPKSLWRVGNQKQPVAKFSQCQKHKTNFSQCDCCYDPHNTGCMFSQDIYYISGIPQNWHRLTLQFYEILLTQSDMQWRHTVYRGY